MSHEGVAWPAAWTLVHRHGPDAPIIATWRCDDALEQGDLDARARWLAVLRAVEELLAERAPPGAAIH